MSGIGSVCSGFGGLDMAVADVFGQELSWFFEFEKAPSKILAHHWPEVPNYGDLTKADWTGIEQVDVMCGGTPCQDLSAAGRRRGMTDGTRSNLWVQMREGIAVQRPKTVIWENVRGAYSACADSEMGRCPRCMGESGEHRPFLRALGRVLGDLSSLGYDARWGGFRASDIGAAHPRFRVFVVATDTSRSGGDEGQQQSDGRDEGRVGSGLVDQRPANHSAFPAFPVPADAGSSRLGEYPRATPAEEAWSLASDLAANPARVRPGQDWGPYSEAIERWEPIVGRPAPVGTVPWGKEGKERANPVFGEWLMGAPEGHITSPEIGLSWADQWTAIGNGVVIQQAELGIRALMPAVELPHSLSTTEPESKGTK